MPRGRPTDYRTEFDELARNYSLLGATEKELGPLLGVTDRTIKTWKKQHESFAAAIAEGAVHANARVIGAHYKKCLEGDMTAIIFWEKNKMGWRDRNDVVARVGISPVDELLTEIEGSTFKPKGEGA
ncbi:hypothetical protein C9I56_11225 [Paraburkholderia caribensis]|uniref:hypothetical protein n=1 Tax=Paraburkholderia caribensis TaxID=75105 RepID=UPI000D160F7D|nr:hypothetical protein [Paraburkholderia caribensis]PTB28854.1 hypothetical protein C9I56_11225 [Paraburkholderia caribensis]